MSRLKNEENDFFFDSLYEVLQFVLSCLCVLHHQCAESAHLESKVLQQAFCLGGYYSRIEAIGYRVPENRPLASSEPDLTLPEKRVRLLLGYRSLTIA